MNNYTPAPWYYTMEGKNAMGIVEKDGTNIAHITTLNNSTAADNMEVNVRLMTAAPELLGALKKCVMTMRQMIDNGEWYTPEKRIEEAEEAISKAEYTVVEWADEPATDQVADKDRPKDLRDEFAMVVSGHIWVRNVDMEINQACEMTANTAYMLADAMLKAREVK